MKSFLKMPDPEKRTLCEQANNKLGLPPASIEKDFWVCFTLQSLFEHPEIGSHLTFKGGTSLSKGWDLIYRFSEDIDIVIDRTFLGFGGSGAPDLAPSKKQKRKRLKLLRTASQGFVTNTLLPSLKEAVSQDINTKSPWRLKMDTDDPDGQTLLLDYPSVFPATMAYILPSIKIEFGARSDTEPKLDVDIRPYLADAFPKLFLKSQFQVHAVSPERTFWEKAMLLHEENFRPLEKKRKARIARHYYDLYCLIRSGIGSQAHKNIGLFNRILAHRQVYFAYTWADYDTIRPGMLKLIPTDSQLPGWRSDYQAMKDEMFFREPPSFEKILETVKIFQDEFNNID